ncbi:MAG TPA: hypothetical protein VFO01_07055 [Trebonia sp.]|nr:hypothetical protein [Trebonia sp.]
MTGTQTAQPADRGLVAETIAVLGAGGTMGFPVARNIARAGLPARGWNRTRGRPSAPPPAAPGGPRPRPGRRAPSSRTGRPRAPLFAHRAAAPPLLRTPGGHANGANRTRKWSPGKRRRPGAQERPRAARPAAPSGARADNTEPDIPEIPALPIPWGR